jgi:hydrogenase maturation protein HypF
MLLNADCNRVEGDPLRKAVAMLQAGHIVAIKGLGGYHLAAGAVNETAVARLRSHKYREDKPFALMARDLASAHRLAWICPVEERLLSGARRPITLMRHRAQGKFGALCGTTQS